MDVCQRPRPGRAAPCQAPEVSPPYVGVVGYVMRLFRFEPAPLLLGFVLGPMMEEQLRRTMLLSRGDPMVFLERPISATLLAITLAIVVAALISSQRRRRRDKTDRTKLTTKGIGR